MASSSFGHRLHKCFPRMFPLKLSKRDYEEIRSRDEEDNLKSEPPPDEIIDLKCMWAVEFYLPMHTKQLIASIDKLGWGDDDFIASPSHKLKTWIENSRARASGGGMLNLGVILRPEDDVDNRTVRRAPLPQSVDYAFGEVYSLTSSITSIVMCFVLRDNVSGRYQNILRKRYNTIHRPLDKGRLALLGPYHQKEEAIRTLRGSIRKDILGWFAENIPGMFSSNRIIKNFPTCELTTFRHANPIEMMEDNNRSSMDWWDLLDFGYPSEHWSYSKNAIIFASPMRLHNDEKMHAAIACKEDVIPLEHIKIYGKKNKSNFVSYVNDIISGMLSRWSLLSMLAVFEKYLNSIRDSAAFEYNKRSKSVALLEDVGKHISNSVNISMASYELNSFAKTKWSFEYNVDKFTLKRYLLHAKDGLEFDEVVFIDNLSSFIRERSAQLKDLDKSVRDILTQYGSMIEARENISLQKSIKVLTWVLVAFTVVLIAFGIMQHSKTIYRWYIEFTNWVSSLC